MKSNNGKESMMVCAAELRPFFSFFLVTVLFLESPLKSSSLGSKDAPNVGFNISGLGAEGTLEAEFTKESAKRTSLQL